MLIAFNEYVRVLLLFFILIPISFNAMVASWGPEKEKHLKKNEQNLIIMNDQNKKKIKTPIHRKV